MLSTEEDYIKNEYYVYNRQLFGLLGLWDYQRSLKKLIYVRFINLITIVGAFEQIYAILTSERKLNLYTKLLETILPTLGAGSCYYNLTSNATVVHYAKLSRKCTIAMIIILYLYIVFLIFPSLLSIIRYLFGTISYSELILPVHIGHFMENHLNYFLIFWHQCIVIGIVCTVGAANYSMFIGIVLHCCALFNVVIWRINDRFKEKQKNLYCDSKNVKFLDEKNNLLKENEWIIDVIKFYKAAIEFVNFVKVFYEATNLFELSLALFMIMIDYYYVFSPNITKTEGLTKLSYVIGTTFLIFAYFYLGQKLIDHSNKVFLTV
ncbi:odorant receptor 46a-like isoform X1 [Vespula maculifrons]|uniref:Odorant receptor 46a-like isoform X1 n=1 Tax=Vespula maculifrons TaxID=7453 RepID=A0ABD2BPC8_VESMC